MNQIVTIICTVGAFLLLLLIGCLRMRGNVKEWLLWAVTQAEQYLGSGRVNGIVGDVDREIAYKDYPAIIQRAGLNRGV